MKTELKKSIEAITDYLKDLSNADLVMAHNQMCQNTQRGDDEIYNNDEEFFNTFFDGKVLDAVRAVSYGDFNYSHEFVMFNGYANLESFSDPTDKIDLSEIAEDIMENENDYNIEFEEEDEEEETE
jgi:hypothetical protein